MPDGWFFRLQYGVVGWIGRRIWIPAAIALVSMLAGIIPSSDALVASSSAGLALGLAFAVLAKQGFVNLEHSRRRWDRLKLEQIESETKISELREAERTVAQDAEEALRRLRELDRQDARRGKLHP